MRSSSSRSRKRLGALGGVLVVVALAACTLDPLNPQPLPPDPPPEATFSDGGAFNSHADAASRTNPDPIVADGGGVNGQGDSAPAPQQDGGDLTDAGPNDASVDDAGDAGNDAM